MADPWKRRGRNEHGHGGDVVCVPRAKLEEIISTMDKALGDTDVTHLETDEEYKEQVPFQWCCLQLSLMLSAAPKDSDEN